MKQMNIVRNMKKGQRNYLILSILLVAFLTLTTIYYPYLSTSDLFDHSSAVKELTRSLTGPKDPLVNVEIQNPRFTPYTFIMAVFSRATGLDVLATMKIFGIINLLIFLAAIYLLARAYFKDENVPFYSLLMLLFMWGFSWNLSGGYNLKLLVFVLPYSSFISFALSILALYTLLRYSGAMAYSAYSLIGAFVFLTHFPSFTFLAVSSMVLAATEDRKKLLIPPVMAAFAFLCSLFWPYYSVYDLFFSAGTNPILSLPLNNLLIKTGPLIFVGIPLWFLSRRHKFLFWGFAVTFTIFVAYWIYPVPYSERYFFYMAFFLQLIIAYWYNRIFSADRKKDMNRRGGRKWGGWMNWRATPIILGLVLAGCIAFQFILIGSFYHKYYSGQIPERVNAAAYRQVAANIGDYDVFISDPQTSFVMPTFSGKAIGHYDAHINTFLPDREERAGYLYDFFKYSPKRQEEIIDKYNVSWIIINDNSNFEVYSSNMYLKRLNEASLMR